MAGGMVATEGTKGMGEGSGGMAATRGTRGMDEGSGGIADEDGIWEEEETEE